MRSRRSWWIQLSVRSTTQRKTPSPLPLSVFFSANSGSTPISRRPCRCGSESSPAGHAAAAAHLAGQVLPGDARLEDEEDAGQCLAVVEAGLPTLGAGGPLGQDRFDDLPEFVGQEGLGHGRYLPG